MDQLRAAYPQWRFTIEKTEEAAMRAEMARELRAAMEAVKTDPKPENTQKLMVLISAAKLVFPAQRPANEPASEGGGVHLQFGKVRAQDNKTYFMAFSDRAKLVEWKRMSYVELTLADYAPLVLNSQDDGVIIDPNVGASLVLTREHIETLQQQVEMFNKMMENIGDFIPGEKADKEESIDDLLNLPPEEKKKGLFGKKKK